MNKAYLNSLGIYLVWNTVVWLLLMTFTTGKFEIGSLLVSTIIATLFHRFLVWRYAKR